MKSFILILFMIITSCDFPKDSEDSWDNAVNDKLKIGVTSHPPFTFIENDSVGGTEIELLRDFARANQVEIEFIEGSESELVKKLENYELHIVAGGFEKKTLWEKKAGLSHPYDDTHVFFVPKGENGLLEKLETFILQNRLAQ